MRPVQEVDVKTAKEWLDNGEAVMVDIREKMEHDMLHVPDIPFYPSSYFNVDEMLKELGDSIKGKKLIVMCHSGRRSMMMCHELMDAGVGNCWNLEGGIMCWANNDLPTVEED